MEKISFSACVLCIFCYVCLVTFIHQVSRNIDLVYGGGSIGLMGLVSHAVHDGGRHVIGVIPKTLMPRELTGETVGEVKAVADMHQRKAEMARHSDAFIALPGYQIEGCELKNIWRQWSHLNMVQASRLDIEILVKDVMSKHRDGFPWWLLYYDTINGMGNVVRATV